VAARDGTGQAGVWRGGRAAVSLYTRSLMPQQRAAASLWMYAMLHRWCRQLAEGQESQQLYGVAVGLVAKAVPIESEAEY
jgi:hypothetical protein